MHLKKVLYGRQRFTLQSWHSRSICLRLLAILLSGIIGLHLSSCDAVTGKVDYSTEKVLLDSNWAFHVGAVDSLKLFNDTSAMDKPENLGFQQVDLPHDWSITGPFDKGNPAGNQGGALPGGIGWYFKSFTLTENDSLKNICIAFDGIYRKSKVWLNGHLLGERPNGFISFEYTLNPYLNFDGRQNRLIVRVDNSEQPNSRWYCGSGINRDVWLIKRGPLYINQSESYFYSSTVSIPNNRQREYAQGSATLHQHLVLNGASATVKPLEIKLTLWDALQHKVGEKVERLSAQNSGVINTLDAEWPLNNLRLWSPAQPYLYTLQIEVTQEGNMVDRYRQKIGFRHFRFDSQNGFYLNGESTKIKGVCLHSDFGVLGTAYNYSAMHRQLKLLKEMGCNAIRTAHNPPAPGMLDLCDSMGFLVMDEAFDMWEKKKTKFDYSRDFKAWHRKDLEDQIKRDRRHTSIICWSIGNEIREQFDTSGIRLTRELVALVKALDTTRPVLSAMTETHPDKNNIAKSGALDLMGFNYKIDQYDSLPINFPNSCFIASETVSALETRGVYKNEPKDTIVYMPVGSQQKFANNTNGDWTVSAYDKVAAYWGTTHENAWRAVKNRPFIAGTFVWTGIDYLGEPVPFPFPARSSYYGIIDQAGLVKDVYYFYQSEWSDSAVLHLLPHWNWGKGQHVDVWCYYNQADMVELFLNGKSLGKRHKADGQKGDNEFHVSWQVPFLLGTLKVVAYQKGKAVKTTEVKTASAPSRVKVDVDLSGFRGVSGDLCYLTLQLEDEQGNSVPDNDRLLQFDINGQAKLVGINNGYQAELRSFQSEQYPTWKGKCVVVVRPETAKGSFTLNVKGQGISTGAFKVNFGK
ncbi:glycoside hydrolase family 2 TIM barrel-domain containing protein [Arachidicoccus rhizosphaerae]|nr:glycoside hydrolase family 2 TIM barrel-domain containing protein [Arachidicoccus rhizosphaerae]